MFTVTIEKTSSSYATNVAEEIIVKESFETKAEAKKAVRLLRKQHDLATYADRVCNFKKHLELTTNF